MIKTIIFDLGKVIVDFEYKKAVTAMLKYSQYDKETIYQILFGSEEYKKYMLGRVSSQRFYEIICKRLKLTCSYNKFSFIWNDIFAHRPKIDELIKKLKRNKYRLVLLSDTNKLAFEFILKNYPILNVFDEVVVSYKHNCMKPSRKIFLIALKKAKCRPEECIFIDDLAKNIEGARKLGINAVQYKSYSQLVKALKEYDVKIYFLC